ncbi:hypothetical protein ALC60_12729 [Trachymyrmex zeteki]|uniref:MADF domain-containing protein n=1 Tax=Mycetomoellerius zeteki TaxID=64791 RepID=A0A151WK94_9HYME|nr:hypothetical protein ALC60_12729 [Trachymyrmex zeteki]
METTVDEVIINFVRDNTCLYEKDVNFKNINKKKYLWQIISGQLRNLYDIGMTADAVKKRWFSLRDMFSREARADTAPIDEFLFG